MKHDDAKAGMGVVYTDGSGKREDGIITSFNDSYAFVRYAGDHYSKATQFEDLELMKIKEKNEE